MIRTCITFLRKNPFIVILLGILLLAAFLRLYRIADFMTFLGDEGRDAMVVKGILDGHFTLLGPRASAGDFFTGPVYYYMIAPFLWLFHLNPVGPAVFIAVLGVITVYLVYWLGEKWMSRKAGLFAAALYAVSPLVIAYSRSSWNPNPMPFFSLVILYLLYLAIQKGSAKLYFVVGILYGIAFQLHYIEMFMGGVILLVLLLGNIYQRKKKLRIFALIHHYVLVGIGFLLGFSPFLLFEIRHGFPNFIAIKNFIFVGDLGAKVVGNPTPFNEIVMNVFERLFSRLLLHFPDINQMKAYTSFTLDLWQIGSLLLAVAALIALFRMKDKLVVIILFVWLLIGVGMFGFYKKPIYDYYFEFMFPLPFLLVGNLLSDFFQMKRVQPLGKTVAVALFVFLFLFNLSDNPLRQEPNRQLNQMRTIAEFTLSKTGGKPFNFALLSHGNSDHAYRYFFELHNEAPVTIQNTQVDPQRKTVTNQLFVVCEDLPCYPLGNSLWEIAGFGRAEIAGEWNVSVVKVYKLTHFQEKK